MWHWRPYKQLATEAAILQAVQPQQTGSGEMFVTLRNALIIEHHNNEAAAVPIVGTTQNCTTTTGNADYEL